MTIPKCPDDNVAAEQKRLLCVGTHFPRPIIRVTTFITLVILFLSVIPSIWPQAIPILNGLKVDTDPENMLHANEPVRVFHRDMKKRFSLYDTLVVGVVNEQHPQGVFNPKTLANITELVNFSRTLQWPTENSTGRMEGVVESEILAPSTVDNIEPGDAGSVRFEWLMPEPPKTDQEAQLVRDRMQRLPMLNGTLLSEDGKALTLFLPLTSKDISYKVYNRLKDKVAELNGEEQYLFTGLPVAEDAFGVEMFIQMAISFPISTLVIFLIMWIFFRNLLLVSAAVLVAVISVIATMGLLIISGNTVHIMSSMIPIFIMPIAVLDSVHILSQFFDRYNASSDRKVVIRNVIIDLYKPMLFTSLTTSAGFASLALTPIPPVQVFGLFIALGVMIAWVLTIVFLPALILRLDERRLQGLKIRDTSGDDTRLTSLLFWMGEKSAHHAKGLLLLCVAVLAIFGYGIGQIQINDNPIRWFEEEHEIRQADQLLNARFGGTYIAYLALQTPETEGSTYLNALRERTLLKKDELLWMSSSPEIFSELLQVVDSMSVDGLSRTDVLQRLTSYSNSRLTTADADDQRTVWDEVSLFLEQEEVLAQSFKQPEVLRYIDKLEQHLLSLESVGNTNSLTTIVKTVYRDLLQGKDEDFRVPESMRAVGQTLLTYQNSHRPNDLWHFVSPDYRAANIWVQMTSGDNQDMTRVVEAAEEYMRQNPPPMNISAKWFGLSYINLVWQEQMVQGMMEAFLGSFGIVFLMMLILLRSGLWAILSMIPLSLTLGDIYGLIGLLGIDYDMPIAVLSALSLGLAVDFAIHYLVKAREHTRVKGTWREAISEVYGAPARAISRNILVISIGFTPLLVAPLIPYQTVGILITAILFLSGAATLIVLPALLRILEPWLFRDPATTSSQLSCTLTTAALIGLVAVNLYQFYSVSLDVLLWAGLAGVILSSTMCRKMRRNNRLSTMFQSKK